MSIYGDVCRAMVSGRTSLKDMAESMDWPAYIAHRPIEAIRMAIAPGAAPITTSVSEIIASRAKLIINRRSVHGNRCDYLMVKICKCNNMEVLNFRVSANTYELQFPLSRKFLATQLRDGRARMRVMMAEHRNT